MGIDIRHNKDRKVKRRDAKSEDIYLKLLIQLYRFLAKRTDAKFNKKILKRFYLSKTNRPPVSVSRLVCEMKSKNKDEVTAVVVGTITNDNRLYTLPKMNICALRVTEGARSRILAAGGKIITFDQLALQAPTGANTHLIEEGKLITNHSVLSVRFVTRTIVFSGSFYF